MNTVNVTMGKITGASDAETSMIKTAGGFVKQVLQSDFFNAAVLAFVFTNTNGLSNQQILDNFLKANLVINVNDFSGNWRQNYVWHTEGYECGDGFVHANRHFIRDAVNMGSLMLHELAHEPLGFHHSSSTEYTSVPYGMNQIFMAVMKQLGIIPADFQAA